ncbi:MAG: hypothetical protein J6T74_08215 [Clostridia bacterium]|nr:hypothetical protein [Clostridia bacterium]
MEIIKAIDLWTEQKNNHYECFNGAFIDGFAEGKQPFDFYKVFLNCNCLIDCNDDEVNITNKHNAIVFYKNDKPVRLMVINENTNIENCIKIALEQYVNNEKLAKMFDRLNIKSECIDLKENVIENNANFENEIDVGSCDRWSLLYSMLKGSYTEDNTKYGNYQSDVYIFNPHIKIKYLLNLEDLQFVIEHNCAFINNINTRIIPIQANSMLTKS